MNDDELTRLEDLRENVPHLPFKVYKHGDDGGYIEAVSIGSETYEWAICDFDCGDTTLSGKVFIAEYIVALTAQAPALIAALRQSRAENERLRAAIEKHREVFHDDMDRLKVENLLRCERRAICGLWEGSKELWASIEKERT